MVRHLWRQHLVPFTSSLVVLTSLMLLNQIGKQLPTLRAAAAPTATILRVFALTVPFIVTMTLPMAVLIAVLRVFTRPAFQSHGASPMRIAAAVLAGATLLAGVALIWNDRLLPRSNHQLRTLLAEIRNPGAASPGERAYKGDRELTIGELRQIARGAEADAQAARAEGNLQRERAARQRSAMYSVEIQKKYAVSAACLVFALLGVGIGLQVRRGGWPLVIAVSVAVFSSEYVALIGGEELGDRLTLSPFLAMWTVNLVLGMVGCVLLIDQQLAWRRAARK